MTPNLLLRDMNLPEYPGETPGDYRNNPDRESHFKCGAVGVWADCGDRGEPIRLHVRRPCTEGPTDLGKSTPTLKGTSHDPKETR